MLVVVEGEKPFLVDVETQAKEENEKKKKKNRKRKKKTRERKSTKTGKSRYACALFYKGVVCNDEMKIIMVSFVSVWSAFVRKGQNK